MDADQQGSAQGLHWQDVEDLGMLLARRVKDCDPRTVRFTQLRRLVETLPGFTELPGHPCNEKILEAIQAAWIEAVQEEK